MSLLIFVMPGDILLNNQILTTLSARHVCKEERAAEEDVFTFSETAGCGTVMFKGPPSGTFYLIQKLGVLGLSMRNNIQTLDVSASHVLDKGEFDQSALSSQIHRSPITINAG